MSNTWFMEPLMASEQEVHSKLYACIWAICTPVINIQIYVVNM